MSSVPDEDENSGSTKRASVLGGGALAPTGRRPQNRLGAILANLSGRAIFQWVTSAVITFLESPISHHVHGTVADKSDRNGAH